RRAFRPEQCALEVGRQETCAPVNGTALHTVSVSEHNVARKILALGSQTIRYPCPRARKPRSRNAGVDLQDRRNVVIWLRVEAVDKRELIHMPRNVGISIADPCPAPAIWFESKRRFHQRSRIAIEDIDLYLLAVTLG